MKLTNYYTSVLTLMLSAEVVMGTCESKRKLDCSLLGDLLEMAMKHKSQDNACQCRSRTKIPAFSSVLTKSQTPGPHKAIKFDKVVTNIRNSYNPKTGIFIAPVPGVYQFSYTAMSAKGKYLQVYLSHNNTIQQSIWLKGSEYEAGTGSMILILRKGDQVAVKTQSSNTVYSDGSLHTSFSGYLIAQ